MLKELIKIIFDDINHERYKLKNSIYTTIIMPNTKKVKKIGPEMTRHFTGFSAKNPKIFPKTPHFSQFQSLLTEPNRASTEPDRAEQSQFPTEPTEPGSRADIGSDNKWSIIAYKKLEVNPNSYTVVHSVHNH